MPDALPHVNTNLQEVTTRNESARHIIAGFSAAMPVLADIWQYLDDALNDVPLLSAEISRLSAELQATRLDRANLLAAARATIAAHHDGEPDPLFYLRDELRAQGSGIQWGQA
jgi:ABC-type transporter Mla subunit MlaD